MKMLLNDVTKRDFDIATKVLKKALKKSSIDQFDTSYLACSLLSLVINQGQLGDAQARSLDQAMGVLMAIANKGKYEAEFTH